jgi:hypothetical protein
MPTFTPAPKPLDIPESHILERLEGKPTSRTARVLAAALRLSIAEISDSDPSNSMSAGDLARMFAPKVDLALLNQFKIVLSKVEGCEMLRMLGVPEISDRFLNRYIDETKYHSYFKRDVPKRKGKGKGKIILTYAEIIYVYTKYLNKTIPDDFPEFPASLSTLANDGDALVSQGIIGRLGTDPLRSESA